MTDKESKAILKIIGAMERRLDRMEETAAWLVSANHRFKVGQRVQFSAIADRRGMSKYRRGGVRKGTVRALDGFIMDVQLDGYKKPIGFHHKFFESVGRKQ